MTTDKVATLFVYAGARAMNDNTLRNALIPLDAIDADADETKIRWFKRRKEINKLVVGGIYEAEANDTSITLEFTRRGWYRDRHTIIGWQASDDAALITERIAKKEKTDRTRDLIAEALEPIVAAYKATDATGKRAIEVLILDRLRRA